MKIEIKKLKIHTELSEETTAYTCEIWVNGFYIGNAKNHGRGGNTFLQIDPEQKELATETNKYIVSNPPKNKIDHIGTVLEYNLTDYIDDKVEIEVLAKECKRHFKKQIIYLDEYKEVYGQSLPCKGTIKEFMALGEVNQQYIKKKVRELIDKGFVILNTDLQYLINEYKLENENKHIDTALN